MSEAPLVDPLRAFLEDCPEPLFIAGADGVLRGLSQPLRDVLGDVTGTRIIELVHPEDRSACAAAWAQLLGDEGPVEVVCRIRTADNLHPPFTCKARRARAQDGFYGSLRPLAAPDASTAQPELERKVFRLLLDHLPITVWAMDGQGVMRYFDGQGASMVKEDLSKFLGVNMLDEYADNPVVLDALRRALAGEPLHARTQAHDQWWETWHMPVRDDEGQVVTVFAATLNVTEARRAEKELRDKLELIEAQRLAIRELSSPIIQVWDRVLTVPLVGSVDGPRAAEVMERLPLEIVRTGARFAILDLTGVDTVDTPTANHLISLIGTVRLLGAEGIVTGIRPVVAQTMTALGLDLGSLTTRANLREGLKLCMRRLGRAGR